MIGEKKHNCNTNSNKKELTCSICTDNHVEPVCVCPCMQGNGRLVRNTVGTIYGLQKEECIKTINPQLRTLARAQIPRACRLKSS